MHVEWLEYDLRYNETPKTDVSMRGRYTSRESRVFELDELE